MKIYREVGSLPIVNREDAEGYVRPVYSIEVEEAVPIEDYQSMEQTVDKLIKALAEAEPIRQQEERGYGEWEQSLSTELLWKCSECKCRYETSYRYCPNCGSKMGLKQYHTVGHNERDTEVME